MVAPKRVPPEPEEAGGGVSNGSGDDPIELLFEITHTLLSQQKELSPKLERALRLLEQSGLSRGVVTLYDDQADELHIAAASGLSAAERRRGRYRPGEGIIGETFRKRQPNVVPNVARDDTFLDRTQARRGIDTSQLAFVCVPIATAGGGPVLGTLSGERVIGDPSALQADVRLLCIIAAIMADVIRTWRAHRDEVSSLIDERRELVRGGTRFVDMPNVIGTSRAMSEVARLVKTVATSDATVLVRGESGTGKELIATAIHSLSPRSGRPFVAVNCGALPEHLIEAELFGCVEGAYTGADRSRRGRFHAAHRGTICLDEIGELALAAQVKLLRVLQDREIYRVGSSRPEPVDVRIIAATNRDLEAAIDDGSFREDLYYRLNVFPIFTPSLRHRKSDITLLADHFVEKYAALHDRAVRRVSSQAIDLMMSYHWPGNVRELENCISRAVLLSDGTIRAHHLPPTLQTGDSSETVMHGNLEDLVAGFEREILIDTMKETGGVISRAAEALGTTPRVLAYRLKKLGLHSSLVRARRLKPK